MAEPADRGLDVRLSSKGPREFPSLCLTQHEGRSLGEPGGSADSGRAGNSDSDSTRPRARRGCRGEAREINLLASLPDFDQLHLDFFDALST